MSVAKQHLGRKRYEQLLEQMDSKDRNAGRLAMVNGPYGGALGVYVRREADKALIYWSRANVIAKQTGQDWVETKLLDFNF